MTEPNLTFTAKRPARCLSLAHLKSVKRPRLVIAIIAAIAMLLSMWALYDTEFHYSNTEAGRLTAVYSYIPSAKGNSGGTSMVSADTPLREIAHEISGKHLFIFYGAENKENVHGILHLIRGINGKYRPVDASISPFPYVAGIYAEYPRLSKSGTASHETFSPLAIAGDSCQGIDSFRVIFTAIEAGTQSSFEAEHIYTVPAENFLWLLNHEVLKEQLGIGGIELLDLNVTDIRYLDSSGNDITDQFRNPSVTTSWGGGKSTAELGMIYVFIGIVAALGIIVIRYLLLDD